MVAPTGVEPVSIASYHYYFRSHFKCSWSGLSLNHYLPRLHVAGFRLHPSSLYTFRIYRLGSGLPLHK